MGLSGELYLKESFVKLFEPWGWIIGTGIYIDDVQEKIAQQRKSILTFSIIILALAMFFLAWSILKFITRPIQDLMRYAELVSAGDYNPEVSGKFYAETARLKTVITKMVCDLQSAITKAETNHLKAQREADVNRELTEKLDALFRSMTELVVLYEVVVNENNEPVDYRITDCNTAFSETTGLPKEEIIGKTSTELYQCNEPPYLNEFVGTATTGEPYSFETYDEFLKRHFIISVTSPRKNEFVTIKTDITERKKAEAALLESEERFRSISEMALDAIILMNNKGEAKYWSPSAEHIFGYTSSEIIGKNLHDILVPEKYLEIFRKGFEHFQKTGRGRAVGKILELSAIHKNGNEFPIEIAVSPIRIQGQFWSSAIIRDISERKQDDEEKKKMDAQLLEAQKMQSIGRLAGGVAHDYNNMLCAIIGYAEMTQMMISPDSSVYDNITQILKAAHHSADITNQLLAFARKQTIQPRILDLNKLVTDMIKMLNRLIPEDIRLNWSPGESLWMINGDPSQINQIMINLIVNARDAISGSGMISVETRNFIFDKDYCKQNPDCIPGDYVLLSVKDTGCGMDNETLESIFEPFFTTKDLSEGTGLGLASIYGIVQQNRGNISVHSKVGQGTVFQIFFPRFEPDNINLSDESNTPSIKSGKETILLVEDERMVLQILDSMITRLGYPLLTAHTPAKAIRLAKEHSSEIDLLITDVIMPEMDGLELAQEIASYCPDIRILFISGYSADIITRRGLSEGQANFITKPFTLNTLSEKIREALKSGIIEVPVN